MNILIHNELWHLILAKLPGPGWLRFNHTSSRHRLRYSYRTIGDR